MTIENRVMNANPKISVIVPVYKVEQYLPRCIDSILAQTFTDFELLLIDDGSPDTRKICDEYAKKDGRIRVFHKKNGGVSSARNLGLDEVKGEWIAFCDSDDWVDSTWLKDFMNTENSDLIVQGFTINRDKTAPKAEVTIAMKSKEYTRLDLDDFYSYSTQVGNTGYIWCRLFKHNFIKIYNIKFNTNYTLCEDEEFITHYTQYISCISTIAVANYHYNAPNFKVKYKLSNINAHFECIYSIIKRLNNLGLKKDNPIIIKNINQLSRIIKNSIIHHNYSLKKFIHYYLHIVL